MNIPAKELTPEKCRELRKDGTLKLMVELLHEHTVEPHDQSEADFNLELFLEEYDQNSEYREELAVQIRKIVENTATNVVENQILLLLELVRAGTEWFYHSFSHDHLAGDFPNQLLMAVTGLGNLAQCTCTRPIVELFGGVFAILDVVRAQTRFYAKYQQFVDPQRHYRLLEEALGTLSNLMLTNPSQQDVRRLLGNCRSFHEQLIGIIKHAHADNQLALVRTCCEVIIGIYLYVYEPLKFYRDGYMSACGVVRCLAELLPQITDPETLSTMLDSFHILMDIDQRNVMEFCSIDGSIGALIDILAPNAEKDADVKNAKVYEQQRECVMKLFNLINILIDVQGECDCPDCGDKLLRILAERDIAVILFPHIGEKCKWSETGFQIESLFNTIIQHSDEQAEKIEELRQRQG